MSLTKAQQLLQAIEALRNCDVRPKVEAMVTDGNSALAAEAELMQAAHAFDRAQLAVNAPAQAFLDLVEGDDDLGNDWIALQSLASMVLQHQRRLKSWTDWYEAKTDAGRFGLKPLVDVLEMNPNAADQLSRMFEAGYARWFAGHCIDEDPILRSFSSAMHSDDIAAFKELDDRLSDLTVRRIRAGICERIPDKETAGNKGGYGILRHQLQLQRRHKPIRQLAAEMGEAFTRLAPCMMMSPLSIAQFLPPDQALFDLVIFDEASQIAPWDAIGAMARGTQVVVAGDPKQMPPTSFFASGGNNVDDPESYEDLDSILEECLAAGVPQLSLSWHYRSKHESLIAFSNHRYYSSSLITFPAANTRKSAVEWRRVQGVWANGKSRTNPIEAQAIVDEAVAMLRSGSFNRERKTLGIITMNADQQQLIENLLDQQRKQYPEIEAHFAKEHEPVRVKNLETAQGDERDVILLGIGYGPTEPGAPTMRMNFGPLNRQGGERRLNVAVTRARQEMRVFSSFDPGMIDRNRTSARAVHDLKSFIEFAARGQSALAETVQGSVGGFESPFEQAVAEELSRLGWQVVPQIGVSRFRVDLGIVHPDLPGDYLIGVECDGAAYHSAATARDRDKVRASILQSLGWNLVRIWSTDWWMDKQGSAEKLHALITDRLEISRRERIVCTEEYSEAAANDDIGDRPQYACAQTTAVYEVTVGSDYRVSDFSEHQTLIDPSAFYEDEYDSKLIELISHVVSQEAPISETLLIHRLARVHGFQRTGRLIRERVMALVARHHYVAAEADNVNFVWPDAQTAQNWRQYRPPATENDVRLIDDISSVELQAAGLNSTAEDKALDVARIFGVRRLTSASRQRIERFIQ